MVYLSWIGTRRSDEVSAWNNISTEFQTAILRNNGQDFPSSVLMALALLGAAELKMWVFWNWLIYEITYSKCTYFGLLCLALNGLLVIVISQLITENG